MSVLRKFLIPVALAIPVLGAHIALAKPIKEWDTHGWTMGAYSNDQTGAFSHCAVSVPYKSGVTLWFSINNNFGWYMGFSDKRWRLPEGEKFQLRYYIDNASPTAATGTAATAQLVLVEMPDSKDHFEYFRNGKMLYVQGTGQSFQFSLDNSGPVLSELLQCAQNNGANSNTSTSSGTPPKNGTKKPEQGGERGQLLEQARKALGERDYEFVYKAMTRYLEIDTSNAEAYLLRGQAINRFAVRKDQNDLYAAAISDLSKALQLSPNLVAALVERGYAYHNTWDLARAREDADGVINYAPGSADGFALRCSVNFRSGRYEDALRDCDRGIQLSPRDSGIFLTRARLNRARKQYAAAESDLETAINLSPRDPLIYFQKGVLLLETGRTKEAVEAFNQANIVEPNTTAAQRGRQSILAVRATTMISKSKPGVPSIPLPAKSGGATPSSPSSSNWIK